MMQTLEALSLYLDDLSTNPLTRDFRDRAKAFESDLHDSRLPMEPRQELWRRYQSTWDDRKRQLEQRRVEIADTLASLREIVDRLGSRVHEREFPEASKALQTKIREARSLSRDQRDELFEALQRLWDERKSRRHDLELESASQRRKYEDEVRSLDFGYDGSPIGQGFGNFERVGDKVPAARERLKEIGAATRGDESLLGQDRRAVLELIDDTWHRVKQSEETTFSVHAEHADQLYNEAYRAVEGLPVREAAPVLKAAVAEVRSLYLTRDDREKYRAWFDELFEKLNTRFEQSRAEWRERNEERLARLRAARDKAAAALERVEANVADNQDKLADAWSDEFRDRVEGWIREGEEKAADIERSIAELDEKIHDVEDRLRE